MSASTTGSSRVKRGLAEMLKGGVIMDVVTPDQAKIAEDAGAVAVMALERVPADIRAQGGVSRMSDPDMIDGIIEAVSIPVMAKARIGHFVEAQVLQELGVDYIDESEVLSPADYVNHIDKWGFTVPFVCGATNLGEALRRINEGAAMIRSKGEAGTGDVSEAMKHIRKIKGEIAAREKIIGIEPFRDKDGIGRCRIVMQPKVISVSPRPMRPFQGWRYLADESAPPDLGKSAASSIAAMPEPMRRELRDLGLL